MERDDLLAALRAALATDLADGVGTLETGLVRLEAATGEERVALLREVFRAAHGLKGSARAAGLKALEAACHEMESLLGAARDQGRPLERDDYAMLLAAVDALADAQRRLAEAPGAALDDALLEKAAERLRARVEAGATSTATPPSTPTAEPPRRPTGAVRLSPERLDALAVAGGAIAVTSQQAEVQVHRVEELVREARQLRRRFRGGAPAGEVEDGLRRLERHLGALRAGVAAEASALARRASRLAGDVRALRLTPWAAATAGLERTARDVAAGTGKDVDVAVSGEGLELDRSVVDALREPLAALVRNAVDHGLEPPGERRAAGKPPRGTVEVAARIDGERLHVRVADDGRGLDPAAIAEEARRRGLAVPADPGRVLELVFLPGFSTRGAVTEVSGRGVGLDVVAGAVRAARGTVTIRSAPGLGTSIELAVPTTLYGLRAVLALDADQVLALPAVDVERVVRLEPGRLRTVEGRPVLLDGDEPIPLAPLGHAVGLAAGPWHADERRLAVVVEAGGRRAAFAVREIVAERELSVEPLTGRLEGLPVATALGSLPGGGLAVVLSARELVEAAFGVAPAEAPAAAPGARPARRVLLADDAATTRALARSILEASGYEVVPAADGEQAWTLLQQHGADVVVSDVEMPRMTGFELARAIRQSPRFARLPVVLLTALESEADRRRGLEAGADAYLVKSAFDQRVLLATLSELLEGKS